MRGYIVLWAIDINYEEMRWNHLYGGATIVDYRDASAWEYSAYAFPVVDPFVHNGEQSGTPSELHLDGDEYAYGFDKLVFDFFAAGSTALSVDMVGTVVDTDLTLLILHNDLRQDGMGLRTTKAVFQIWNENETAFSGMEFCIEQWHEALLSALGGHFLLQNLHTDKGRARINGVDSVLCPGSTDDVLVGVAARLLTFNGGQDACMTGVSLAGGGEQEAIIFYDPHHLAPEKADPGQTTEGEGAAGTTQERF
jgi:hypothetical protein